MLRITSHWIIGKNFVQIGPHLEEQSMKLLQLPSSQNLPGLCNFMRPFIWPYTQGVRGQGWRTLRKWTIIRFFRHYFCFFSHCFQIRKVCLVLHWNTLLIKVIWKVELIWENSSWKTTHNGTKLVAFLPPCLLISSSTLPYFLLQL